MAAACPGAARGVPVLMHALSLGRPQRCRSGVTCGLHAYDAMSAGRVGRGRTIWSRKQRVLLHLLYTILRWSCRQACGHVQWSKRERCVRCSDYARTGKCRCAGCMFQACFCLQDSICFATVLLLHAAWQQLTTLSIILLWRRSCHYRRHIKGD